MPFAFCLSCGEVVNRRRGPADSGVPVGPCSVCGMTMYSTTTPFAEIASRQLALAARRSSASPAPGPDQAL